MSRQNGIVRASSGYPQRRVGESTAGGSLWPVWQSERVSAVCDRDDTKSPSRRKGREHLHTLGSKDQAGRQQKGRFVECRGTGTGIPMIAHLVHRPRVCDDTSRLFSPWMPPMPPRRACQVTDYPPVTGNLKTNCLSPSRTGREEKTSALARSLKL